jgi:signal transduction histidine kinase
MFERFHRVRNTRARTHEGTGIGLALVQELSRLHGGGVSVASADGRGTTFTVTVRRGTTHLPADRISTAHALESTRVGAAPFVEEALRWLGDAHVPAPGAPSTAREDAPRVLVADDNADMRDYLARILGHSYRVEAVADGRAALDRIEAQPPDLVLADVMMPELDGFGLLAAVRQHTATRSLPFVLLSARAGEEARIEGLQAGADEYLVKPFSARELQACVASQLQLAAIRREAERERTQVLEEASQIKDDFLASLSHELRTPLSAILGYARLLRSNVIAQDKVPKAIETIERNATSLTQIVEDVLDISRIVSGKLRLKVQPVDFPQIVRVAVDAVAPAADAKGVRVETILDPQAAPISGDPERLQQIIWNLLTNAVKFTPRGGKVQVRLARVNSSVEFAVSDTGIGIAPEFLPHVFERFRQAEAGIARERGGLGLGLSIARQLTEMHGGTIEAFSGGVGQGSTFRVTVPLMILHPATEQGIRVHPRADVAPRHTTVVDLRGVHVLVVDDERDALSLVAEVLEGAGADVKTADSAQRGLAALDQRVPDVIVADLGMPHMDGFQFIDRIRTHPNPSVKNVPAAALTAYARSEDRVKALTAGFHIHLIKPIDPAELVTTVAALARRFTLR